MLYFQLQPQDVHFSLPLPQGANLLRQIPLTGKPEAC